MGIRTVEWRTIHGKSPNSPALLGNWRASYMTKVGPNMKHWNLDIYLEMDPPVDRFNLVMTAKQGASVDLC